MDACACMYVGGGFICDEGLVMWMGSFGDAGMVMLACMMGR